MMAHGRLREPERADEVADARLGPRLTRDEAEQPEPAGVGDRLEGGGELLGVVAAQAGPQEGGTAASRLLLHRHGSILTLIDVVCKISTSVDEGGPLDGSEHVPRSAVRTRSGGRHRALPEALRPGAGEGPARLRQVRDRRPARDPVPEYRR